MVGWHSSLKGGGDGLELRQCRREVLDDLPRDDLGCGQVVQVLQRLVAEPRDVEVGLVPRDEVLVVERVEPLGLSACRPVLPGPVARDEVVEVGPGEGVLLEREVLIGGSSGSRV